MNAADLQRYKRLLLAKLDELSIKRPRRIRWLPERAICKGMLSIKRTPTRKQTCTSGCTKATLISCGRSRTH